MEDGVIPDDTVVSIELMELRCLKSYVSSITPPMLVKRLRLRPSNGKISRL